MLGEHSDIDEIIEDDAEEVLGEFDDLDEAESAIEDLIETIHEKEDLRPNYDAIVEEAASYFVTYVGKVANAKPIVPDTKPETGIENLTELQEYHFLRTGVETDADERAEVEMEEERQATTTDLGTRVGVRDFLCLLEDRLRTVDTAVTREVREFEGEIRGRIDWQQTLKRRAETGRASGQQYACRVRDRDALSARNRVVLELLGELLSLAERYGRRHADGEFPAWLDGWGENGQFRTSVESGLSNAHFGNVDTGAITVAEREVVTVRRDRDPLYREAAALLDRLRQIDQGDIGDAEAETLLGMDVFKPDEEEDEGESTVYELYWHFEIVDAFENAGGLQSIKLGDDDDLVAAWEDEETDSRYLLFNDWNGKATLDGDDELEYLRFGPPDAQADEGPDLSTARAGHVHQGWRRIRKQGLEKKFREEEGTPDIVLLELDAAAEEPTIRGVFVGEVKRTDSAHTIDEGIAQLAEYGAFAEIGDDATLAGEPDADYVATNSDFLADDRLELGLFVSSGYQVEDEPDEI